MNKKEYVEKVENMTWSFSRLNGFGTCKYCWYQSYIVGRRDEAETNAFAEYGLMLHNFMEDLGEGNIFKWQIKRKFEEKFKSIPEFPPNKYVDLRKRYRKNAIDFIENGLDFLDDYDIIANEEKVDTEINGYKFTGYIDVIYKDGDDLIVMDYKSKKDFKSKKEKMEYARQLYLYAIHVKEEYGEYPKRLEFYHFRTQKTTLIFFDEKQLEKTKQWMLDTIEEIKNTEVFPSTDDYFFGNYLCNFRNDKDHGDGAKVVLD